MRRRRTVRAAALAAAAVTVGGFAAAESAGNEGAGGRAVIRVTVPGAPTVAGSDAFERADPWLAGLGDSLPRQATMVVVDSAAPRHLALRPNQAARPLPPCSTFKIPNTLIALGAGAVSVEDNFLPRDPERDPRQDFWSPAWDQDQDLVSALRHSTVWYFQELARRVGEAEMQRQVDRLDYGNRDLSAGIDRFWLGGSLLISADDQVRFLQRLHAGDFEIPAEHLALLRQGLRQDDHPDLYAKTGACPIGDSGRWVGWWVGWIERPEGPAFFAYNVIGASYEEIAPRRLPPAKTVLAEMGLLPPQ